jgi:hypothetical protein
VARSAGFGPWSRPKTATIENRGLLLATQGELAIAE